VNVLDYRKEDKIAFFTLNRPDSLNALNTELRQELSQAMINFNDDPNLWVGIVMGPGKAFSAGADIKEFRPVPIEAGSPRLVTADQIWKPFIAAIHGYCLGGGLELALDCDLRIAAEGARFGYPEVFRGLPPGSGSTQRLRRFLPLTQIMELMMLGHQIDAEEAYRIGLINKVVSADLLILTARNWAETICKAGPLAVRAVKELTLKGYDLPMQQGLELEREVMNHIRRSHDFMEGARAFVEKRQPDWKAS
jgi:enoyl-CoA hydratase/carnithine racemase